MIKLKLVKHFVRVIEDDFDNALSIYIEHEGKLRRLKTYLGTDSLWCDANLRIADSLKWWYGKDRVQVDEVYGYGFQQMDTLTMVQIYVDDCMMYLDYEDNILTEEHMGESYLIEEWKRLGFEVTIEDLFSKKI